MEESQQAFEKGKMGTTIFIPTSILNPPKSFMVRNPTVNNYISIKDFNTFDLKDFEWSRRYINTILNTLLRPKHDLKIIRVRFNGSSYLNFDIDYLGYGMFYLHIQFRGDSASFQIYTGSGKDAFSDLVWSPNKVKNFRSLSQNERRGRNRRVFFDPKKPRFRKWVVSALKYVRDEYATSAIEYVMSV